MYQRYFGFRALPFSAAPDPRALYLSEQHREALANLLYVARNGGFALLSGEVGAGKTTICRCLLEQLPVTVDVGLIFNPKLRSPELLAAICDEFGIRYPPGTTSLKTLVDLLNRHLLRNHARGRSSLLIIDEAQNLSVDALELVRLLTNLETSERKLLQIILVGQSELRRLLDRPELRQLAQRITVRCHLGPLARADVAPYVAHRLRVAGVEAPLFPPRALAGVFRFSGGIPRLINAVCDRALLGAYVERRWRVAPSVVGRAARELRGAGGARRAASIGRFAAATGCALVLAAAGTGLTGAVGGAGVTGAEAAAAIVMPPPLQSPPPSAPPPRMPAPAAALPLPSPDAAVAGARLGAADPTATDRGVAMRPEWQRSRLSAFRAVLQYWGVTLPRDAGEPCEQATAYGLRCLRGSGTLAHLQRYNRPAVLTLVDDQGGSYAAALVRLGAADAAIWVDGRPATVPLTELSVRWTGEYTLIWRAPPGFVGPASLGERGALSAWVAARLGELGGGAGPAGGGVDAAALAERLRRFQKRRGLDPTGQIDARTVVELALLDADGPVLMRPTGAP
jgi:general secretion pathway protein A